MLRLTIKQLAARKARLATTTAAVVLGVTFLAGTMVLTDSIDQTLDTILADANAGTDAYVRRPSELDLGFGETRARLDADLVDQIRTIDGVDAVAGRIIGYAQVLDHDGEPIGDPQMAPAFGLNWIDNADLNAYSIAVGHAPAADDEVVIDERSARIGHLDVGDRTTALTGGEPREVTVVGIATFGGAESPGNATAVLFTEHAAQVLLADTGQVDGIAVTATAGFDQQELVDSITTQLHADVDIEVVTGAELTRQDQQAVAESLSFFYVFMWIFAAIGVFVGAFIINNIFSITVAQRTQEMALLRAIGADRRQVLRNVLLEAAIVGALATAVGLALGRATAAGLVALLESFGFDMPSGPVVLTARTVLIASFVGIIVTIASAWLPARRAAKIAPVAAMRRVAFEQHDRSTRRVVVGAVVTTLGVSAVMVGLAQGQAGLVGLGAALVFIGVSVLGPVLVRPVSFVLGGPISRLRGVSGQLARQNTSRNPARTARTASALMIGVGLVGFITIFAASLRTSIEGTFVRDFTGNVVVDSGAFDSTFGISRELATNLREQDGVSSLSEARIAHTSVSGSAEYLNAFDPSTIGSLFDLGTIQGDLNRLDANSIAVFTGTAADNGWQLGDTVPVTFAGGTHDLTIAVLFDRSETWLGTQFVSLAAFDEFLPGQFDARIYLATDSIETIKAAAANYPSADVLDEHGFVDAHNQDVNALLGLIYALLALAVLIALLGIANTLALSIIERTRELGLIRALGMSRAQLRTTIRWEAILLSLFGTTLGLAIGTFFGWAMVAALADEGIETLTIPWTTLGVVTTIAALAGVAAATMPARRAARLDILRAIACN
jgi:putative ABC transport system permease protein